MRIAVIGSGPAGLLAAFHAYACGATDVRIFSNGGRSVLYGAQYLHAPIVGITQIAPQTMVDYKLLGSAEQYRSKVYGTTWDGRVSPDEFGPEEPHPAWDIRQAYSRLWETMARFITQQRCNNDWLGQHHHWFDRIFWTAPATHLCHTTRHRFESQIIYAIGDAPSVRRRDLGPCDPDTILCSGRPEHRWYRLSNIFDHRTAEYPLHTVPPMRVVKVRKPLSTDCNCWPEVTRLGRYGAWRKGYLVHEVMADVERAMR